MGDEVSGSEVYQITYLRVVLLAKISERGYIDSFIDVPWKNKAKKGKQAKAEDVAVKFVKVSAGNLHLKEIFNGFRSYENLLADNQERKRLRWNGFGSSRETRW